MAAKDSSNGSGNGAVNGSAEKFLDWQKVWSIIRKNWIVLKRDKARLIPLLSFPLIMIMIYGSTAGTSTTLVHAAVVDYDNSAWSHATIADLYANNVFTIGRQLASQDEARRLLDTGDIKVAFVIPYGYGADLDAGRSPQLSVVIDDSDQTTSAVAKAASMAIAARVSQEAAAARLARLDAEVGAAALDLDSAKAATVNQLDEGRFGQLDRSTNGAYASVASTQSSLATSLSASSLAQRNTLGEVVDPNYLILFPASAATSGLNGLVSLAGSQQNTLAAAAYYDSINAGTGLMLKQSAVLNYNYKALRQAVEADRASLRVAYSYVDSARSSISRATDVVSASSSSVSVQYLDPYGSGRRGLDFLLPNILALVIFQGAAAGLGRAIAGDRENGSITRMFLTPTSNTTIIVGTQLFYLCLEAVRSLILITIAVLVFGVSISGSLLDVLAIVAIYAIGATGVGMVLSVMAHTQEQYQAISLLVIVPTIFLSGVFFPIQTLPSVLQGAAYILPMAPAAAAMSGVMVKGFGLWQVLPSLAYLVVFGVAMLGLSLMMFKRELV